MSKEDDFFPPPPAIERAPCAFCGQPTCVTFQPPRAGLELAEDMEVTQAHVVTVEYKANAEVHPKGDRYSSAAQGFLRTVTLDICPKCFTERLQPWFAAEAKGEARIEEQSWGAETSFSRPDMGLRDDQRILN